MSLSEYNACIRAYGFRQKQETARCILTGFYAAYYTNGGRKARPPQELIDRLYRKKERFDEGIEAIERAKQMDKNRKEAEEWLNK